MQTDQQMYFLQTFSYLGDAEDWQWREYLRTREFPLARQRFDKLNLHWGDEFARIVDQDGNVLAKTPDAPGDDVSDETECEELS